MSVIIKLLSKFDDSGIKKAQHSFGGLKSALGAIGIGYGLKQVADLLMESAKAASADAKSINLMNLQLTKNAGATKETLKQNDAFIESLSLQTGILDDDLRPTLSKFANLTHNVGKAQTLLKLSLDVTAGSGKSQTKVANALAKAYAGNTKSLIGMFPELKNSKDALGDLTKEFQGAALVNADPFMKFNNSMDILKEKLGNTILPMIADFATELTKPGGVVEQVGKFLDDLKDPKTEAGQMFKNIKDAVKDAFQGVKNFFALFGNGDAMKGFGNIASALVKMLPALIALKGIMFLAQTGAALKNLAIAIGMIQAKGVTGGNGIPAVAGGGAKPSLGIVKSLGFIAIGTEALMAGADALNTANADAAAKQGVNWDAGMAAGVNLAQMMRTPAGLAMAQKMFPTTNNVTINVHAADPKATVDAVSQFVKTNGQLPSSWLANR